MKEDLTFGVFIVASVVMVATVIYAIARDVGLL